jgi:hypothetical protein
MSLAPFIAFMVALAFIAFIGAIAGPQKLESEEESGHKLEAA